MGKKIKKAKRLLEELPPPPSGKTGWPWDVETDPEGYSHIDSPQTISIITPAYNQGRYIEQSIRSVLLQNYPDLEYTIIDGGSNDETLDIVKKYEPWLKYWTSEKDRGQSHALNKGLKFCSGEIFNWLNSDDYYNMHSFKYVSENFADPGVDVVTGKYRFFDSEGKKKDKVIDFRLRDSLGESIALVLINQPSTFFRLKVVKNLGGIDERLHHVMDQELWKKYLFKYGQGRIRIINDELANFRLHPESKTFQFEFNNEYGGILYSIAKKAGMKKHLPVIHEIFGEEMIKDYEFDIDFTDAQVETAKKAINSLIFFHARNAYTAKKLDRLKRLFSVIESKWLTEYQKNYTFNLKIKSKMIKYKLSPVLKLMGSGSDL